MASSFLDRILPSGGGYFVLEVDPRKAENKGRDIGPLQSLAQLEHVITRLALSPVNLYVATGSYDGRRLAAKTLAKRVLYLDLDSKDFNGSKVVALQGLDTFCKSTGIPLPAILVDSGNGIHAYWPLKRDLPLAEWRALADALKGKCAELGFAADKTVTADAARVLRVPGTMNVKGAVPVPCRLLRDNQQVFDPAMFAAQLKPVKGLSAEKSEESTFPQRAVDTSMNADLGTAEYEPPTYEDVTGMLEKIVIADKDRDSWLKVMAALHHWSEASEDGFALADWWCSTQYGYKGSPDVRKTWDSFTHSDAFSTRPITIATVVKLAREAGWKREEPAEVIAAPAEIAEQIAEQIAATVEAARTTQTNFTAAAQAKLDNAVNERRGEMWADGRAKPELSYEDARQKLTADYIYVINQGTYYSTSQRQCFDKEIIDDMHTWEMPRMDNGQKTPPCKILKNSVGTRIVDSLGFFPGQGPLYAEKGRRWCNLYTQPAEEIKPTVLELKLFANYVDYLFPRPEDQAFKQYWKQFLAHAVQHPSVKIATAMLFISGAEGIGKTTALFEIPRLLVGYDNAREVPNSELEERFTGYMAKAHLLYLSEVHINGQWNSSKIANKLKAVVTDSTITIEQKGRDAYNIPNRLLVTATSNYEDAMHISSNQNRRWAVYELSPTRRMSETLHRQYFNLLYKWLASDRAAGVLRYIFARLDLKGFDPQNPPPFTFAKSRMALLSQSEEVQVIADAHDHGSSPFHRDVFTVEDIRQLVCRETGKLLSSRKTSSHIVSAVPDAVTLGVKRYGNDVARVWCYRNFEKWHSAESADLNKELKR